jgi:tetratricopeptide (TPR) repeat protein
MPEAAMQLLNRAHDSPLKKLAAHFLAAKASFWLGEFESARVHSEQAIALYDTDQLPMMLEQFRTDLSVFSMSYRICALYFLGFPNRAQLLGERMVEQARELAHPHTLAQALSCAAVLHRWLNKPAKALSLSAEAIAISRQHDFSLWLVCGEMTHGWALVMHGQDEMGIAELQSSITGMRAATGAMSVHFLSALIEAYLHLERHNEALDLIAEALADTVNTGDGHFTAELYRLKGVCLLALSPSNAAQAESCYDQALAISRRQGAKALELRATISMTRLWRQKGKHEDARRLLEEIYNEFTEDFDSHDLQEAAKFLRTLI